MTSSATSITELELSASQCGKMSHVRTTYASFPCVSSSTAFIPADVIISTTPIAVVSPNMTIVAMNIQKYLKQSISHCGS